MDEILVSAIVTTYKREWKYIERAINSIISQTYKNIEIILVDDNEIGSEYSKKIKENIATIFSNIRYIKQNGNKGACAARNLGMWNANGFFIAYLDDDDEWLPEKIEMQVNAYLQYKDSTVGMVSCDGFKVEEKKSKKPYNYFGIKNIPQIITFNHMLKGDYVGTTSQPLIRTDVIQSLNGFKEGLPARQDYEMWLRISKNKKILFVRERLFLHHMHRGEQISTNPLKCAKGYMFIYKEFYKEFQKNHDAKKMILLLIKNNIKSVMEGWKWKQLIGR